jgi:hypothetical protein
MLSGRSFSQKIRRQGQKDVTSRIIPTNIQKLLIVFYRLLKMTTGCHALALEPEQTNHPIKSIFTDKSNYMQCFNIPSGHQFAFKIHQTLKQLNMAISNKFMASIIEEHFHYADQYATMLEKKIRIQLYLVQNIQQNSGRILSALAILAVIGKIIGFKTLVLILFGMYLIQLTQAKKPTTLQGLHNTLLYIRFRRNYNWLSTGFGEQKYNKMETALTDAIIQLQQIATPPPPRLLKFQFSKPIMREFIASFMLL